MPTQADIEEVAAKLFPKNQPAKPPAKSIFQRIGDALNQEQDTEREMATANAANVQQDWQQGTATAKEGLGKLGRAYGAVAQPPAASPEQRRVQRDQMVGALKEVPKGASQVFRGSMEAVKQPMLSVAAPMIAAGGVPAVAGAAAGMVAQEGVERGIKLFGNKAIAPEPPTMPKQPGDTPGMGKTGGEQVEGLAEAAGDVAGLFTFGAEAATAKGTNAVKGLFGKAKSGAPTINGQTVASLAEALKEKALNGKQNEVAYLTLLDELKAIDPEAAKPFEAASPRAQLHQNSPETPLDNQNAGGPPPPEVAPAPFKSAEESAAIFQEQQPAYPEVGPKSARESAQAFREPAPRLSRDQRRASSAPPETGLPEEVVRGQAAREDAAMALGKRWQDLSNPERVAIDDLIAEQKAGAGSREPTGPSIEPQAIRPNPSDRPGRQIISAGRTAGQRGSFSNKPLEPPKDAGEEDLALQSFMRARNASAEPVKLGQPANADVASAITGAIEGKDGGSSLSQIRESMPGVDKATFDRSVMDLYKGGKVFLDRHDHPAALTPAEKAELVHGGGEDYYIGISRRDTQRGSFSNRPVNDPPNTPIPKEELTPDDFVNFKRMVISPGEETALRGRIQQGIDDGTMTKDVEHHSAILAHAAEIGPEALRNVMAHGPGEGIGGRAAVQAMRDRQLGISREIIAARRTLEERRPSMSDQDAMGLESKIAQLENDEKQYLQWTAGQRTEAGRNLSALRIMANATLDMGAWTSKARSAMGLPPKVDLPPHVINHVRALVVAAQQAAESGDVKAAALAKGKLAQGVAKLEETGWLETVTTLWKAGLLTAPPTHLVNLGGNVKFQTMELASRIPSSIVDMVISAKTGQRTVAGWSPKEIPAAVRAAMDGVNEARAVLKTGMTPQQLLKGDIPRELNFQKANPTLNAVINWYGRFPFRALSAEDRVFKVYAAKNSVIQQAKLQAINEYRSGVIPRSQYAQRISDLMNNPTEQMLANADLYANYATFNNENALAAGATSFVNTASRKMGPVMGPAFKAGSEFVIPFKNTPANIFERLLDYSPVGMVARPAVKALEHRSAKKDYALTLSGLSAADRKIAVDKFNKSLTPEMQKTFSEAVGRGMVGSAMMYAGYLMAEHGRATGPRPNENKGQSNVERRAGQTPGSIKIGDQWIQTIRLAPGGNLVATGAAMQEAGSRELKDEIKRPWNFVRLAGQTMLEQPMLEGMRDTIEAMDAPSGKRMNKLAADKAGSFVPAFVSRTVAPIVNPEVPQTQPPSDAGMLGTIGYGIQSRLPGLRNNLPPLTDIFGNKVPSTRAQALFPLRTSEDRTQHDPLDKSLMEVKAGINQINQIMPESDKEFAARSAKDGEAVRRDRESDEEYNARKIATGGLIEEALREALPSLPEDPDERKKAIAKIVRKIHGDLTGMAKHDPDYLRMAPPERAQYLLSLPQQHRP